MPTLDWIGKQAVVNHHREVPYRLVHCDSELSAGDPDAGNLLVQGDNLEALRALLPYYAGKVKCIYIDPPYNTGNEKWIYNDNVNSPEIREWLRSALKGKYVDAEDLSRHDKWLCMMYPRVRLLREFLKEDGAIFISIDDNEIHGLRNVCDEVFGRKNFIAQVVWNKKASPANDATYFSGDHEYVCVYAKNSNKWRPNREKLNAAQKQNYTNPDGDERGPWNSSAYTCAKSSDERPNLYYAIKNPNTGEEIWPRKTRVWAFGKEATEKNLKENRIYWGKDGKSRSPRIKKFLSASRPVVPRSVWGIEAAGSTQNANAELTSIMGDTGSFPTPKTLSLIQKIIRIGSDPGDLILDSFAGSGTTGHAVLGLNDISEIERKFILVEMACDVSEEVTALRLQRAIKGYNSGGNPAKPVKGFGGGFRFCRLGVPLFDEFGDVATEVTFPDLAAHIFFSETGVPIPKKATTEFLGTFKERAVYLLFDEANAERPREAAGNVLTPDRLNALPPPPKDFEGTRVVYAEGCTVSKDRLKNAGVYFKQIPYQIDSA